MASASKQYKAKPFHMWQRSGKELKAKNKCRGLYFYNSALRQQIKKETNKEIEEDMKGEWSDSKELSISQEEIEYFNSQENNIFLGAKFRDAFLARNGRMFCYVGSKEVDMTSREYGHINRLHLLIAENEETADEYLDSGVWWTSKWGSKDDDIVSKYNEKQN